MVKLWDGTSRPEPPTDLLFESAEVTVRRLHGRPRDGVTGQHRRVVIYFGATVHPIEMAELLHATADSLPLRLPEAPL